MSRDLECTLRIVVYEPVPLCLEDHTAPAQIVGIMNEEHRIVIKRQMGILRPSRHRVLPSPPKETALGRPDQFSHSFPKTSLRERTPTSQMPGPWAWCYDFQKILQTSGFMTPESSSPAPMSANRRPKQSSKRS